MKLRSAIRVVPAVLAAKWFGHRVPLIVSTVVTTRCNFSCRYCGCWRTPTVDLDHEVLLRLFREMAQAGSQKIIFTGGEPFLRPDFTELVIAAKANGLTVAVNSNGSLLSNHPQALKLLDGISLSLDGPEEIHDAVRARGSFHELLKNAKQLRELGVPLRFAVVVSKLNLEAIDDLLAICKQLDAKLSIQPASTKLLFSELPNALAPDPVKFQRFVDRLIRAKEQGSPVSNSYQGLAYMRSWPTPKPIRCAGGRIFCRIEANGDITICGRTNGKTVAANLTKTSFAEGFASILEPQCNSCWCGLLAELNLSFQLNPATIYNTLRYF